MTNVRRAIYVYGTRGYGKSHMLAALACLLVRQGERVVYLPDCFAMLHDPLEYLQLALLFTIRNVSSREQICRCETVEALAIFFASITKLAGCASCRSTKCPGPRTAQAGRQGQI
jgi:hypothetical protein